MRASKLKAAVRFDRRQAIAGGDGYGNDAGAGAWATLVDRRSASLLPTTRGGEEVIAARRQKTALWDLRLRYDSAVACVTTDDRVVEISTGRTFNILMAEDPDGLRRDVFMQLQEGVADG